MAITEGTANLPTDGTRFSWGLYDGTNFFFPREPRNKAATTFSTSYAVGADAIGTALAPTKTPSRFRIQVAFSIAAIFRVLITRSSTLITLDLNNGDPLAADVLYLFDIMAHSGDTINFRFSASGAIRCLDVDELSGISV